MLQASYAQQLLENLTTSVLWLDRELHLKAMNPAAESLLEISAKKACGLHIEALLPDSTFCLETLQRLILFPQTVTERGMPLYLPNQHTITVDCSINPVFDEHQLLESIVIEITQVDQHLRITREENLLIQHQAVRNMVRGLAHEIKNPLGGLRGSAQLLERELPDPALREYTDVIIEEADRLQNLLNRMLGPSSLPERRMVNIHQVLMRVCQLILSETTEGVSINNDFDPSIPEIEADPDQLIQAVLNIMRNAVQAMNGQGKICLQTRVQRQMNVGNKRHKLVLQIDIRDNGPGVSKEMINQIFYPLVTGRAEGTGLGLSIAQSLINQHGGLIECNSEPNNTVFTLWLPME